MVCYACDVNENNIGINAKFIILFSAWAKLGVIFPILVILWLLVRFGGMKPGFYGTYRFLLCLLYFPWAVYCVFRFFNGDNHTKDEAGFLYAGLLFLMIEGMILLMFCAIVFLIIIFVCCVVCFLFRRASVLERERQENNANIGNLINQLDVLQIMGNRFKSGENCIICFDEFKEGDDVIVRLPWEGKHMFHKKCIVTWIQNNNICPICRTEITEEILEQARRDYVKSEDNYGTIENQENPGNGEEPTESRILDEEPEPIEEKKDDA